MCIWSIKARWQILNRAMNVKLEDVPTLVHELKICELKGSAITRETVEHQMHY